MIQFEWDERKNLSNKRKHSVTFQQAIAVFDDPHAVLKPDRIVEGEQRWQITEMRRDLLLLLVVHTIDEENSTDEVVRIISARLATPRERQIYEAENGPLHP